MKELEILTELSETLVNPFIDEWKKQGKKVIGYYCPYMVEEIIYAAGALPYRIRGTESSSTTHADEYLHSTNCSSCRNVLDLALKGKYSFLDGFAAVNSCDHIRRMFDIWRKGYVNLPYSPFFLHLVSTPYITKDYAIEQFKSELITFKDSLAEYLGVEITEKALRDAIQACNESRRLLKKLYEFRKRAAPPISGAQTLAVVIAGTCMPKAEYNQMLGKLVEELDSAKGISEYRARLMVVGSEIDDPDLVKLIEDCGGLVVADYTCYGPIYFWDLVDESLDAMEGLARRYLRRLSCPRMVEEHGSRTRFIEKMVEDFGISGIIFQRLLYCDVWSGEGAMLAWKTKEAGIPFLSLEREYLTGAVGALKVRIEAFIEMIGDVI